MQITEIKYKKNIHLGNYQHEHVELTMVLNEDDDLEEAYRWIKDEAGRALRRSACR